nr:10754_t:CDS:2 [Entrophospora candida]
MARNYLAISASSIPVERIFSGGTGLITSTRCSLSVDTISEFESSHLSSPNLN